RELREEVAEHARTVEGLRRSESLLRLVWDCSADGMRLTDAAGAVRMANDAYGRLVGLPRAAVEGRPFTDAIAPARRDHSLDRYRERFASRAVRPRADAEV